MREQHFIIPIQPVVARRVDMDDIKNQVTSTRAEARRMISIHLLSQMVDDEPFKGPLSLSFQFYLLYPVLKRDQKPYPTCKPLIDHFVSFYSDLLIYCKIIQNKAEIIDIEAKKRYDEKARVEITIKENQVRSNQRSKYSR